MANFVKQNSGEMNKLNNNYQSAADHVVKTDTIESHIENAIDNFMGFVESDFLERTLPFVISFMLSLSDQQFHMLVKS